MYQIDNSTASSVLDAPSPAGAPGYFTNGNPATGLAPTVVPAEFLNMLMMEMVNLVSAAGLTPSKADRTQVAAAVKALAQSYQVGVVGQARNLFMNIAGGTTSAALTADELIVESALGGLRYSLSSLNLTINLATDMDTGSAPASGFVAVYVGYNSATGARKAWAQNATSAKASETYTGGHAPDGYTASALVAVVPTNSSGQFAQAVVVGRTVSIANSVVVNNATVVSSPTASSLAGVVPYNAVSCGGTMGFSAASAVTAQINVYPVPALVGSASVSGAGIPAMSGNFEVGISQARTIYMTSSGSVTAFTVAITRYSF